MSKRNPYPHGPGQPKSGLSSKDCIGIALIIVAILATAGVGYWYYTASESHVAYDKGTYCPDSGPYARIALLIDLTDEMSFIQEQKLRHFIQSLSDESREDSVPQHAMLSVYLLSENDASAIPTPVIEVCNPGNGEGINEFTGNPRLANKRFTERFLDPIDTTIGKIVYTDPAKTSPIIESIRGIAVSNFAEEAEPGYEHRLIVISDMLQNTPKTSHYREGQILEEATLRDLKSDLQFVDRVDIKVIARQKQERLQGKALVEYWRNYFRESGTNLTTAERWGE